MLRREQTEDFQKFDEKRFTKKDIFKTDSCLVFMLNFLPGQEMPAHRHPGREMNFHVLKGSGTLRVGEKEFAVAQGDILQGSGEEMISFVNTGTEQTSIHVVMNKNCS